MFEKDRCFNQWYQPHPTLRNTGWKPMLPGYYDTWPHPLCPPCVGHLPQRIWGRQYLRGKTMAFAGWKPAPHFSTANEREFTRITTGVFPGLRVLYRFCFGLSGKDSVLLTRREPLPPRCFDGADRCDPSYGHLARRELSRLGGWWATLRFESTIQVSSLM